jgi:predicted LPLAT superfamily acyltransferase
MSLLSLSSGRALLAFTAAAAGAALLMEFGRAIGKAEGYKEAFHHAEASAEKSDKVAYLRGKLEGLTCRVHESEALSLELDTPQRN